MENLISIADYAKKKGVTTQAVYKQLKTHEKELLEKVVKKGGKRFLTEDAVIILNSSSNMSAPVLVDSADKELLEKIIQENKELQVQLKQAQIQLLNAKDTIISMQVEKMENLAVLERSKLLLEQKEEELQILKKRPFFQRLFSKA
ncbi:MAG: hypothetical protein PHZ10_08505 [Aliarcobacter cryaerophilus]|nr:hypothetical protein [Aliarcobacter cryaerophilus]